MKFAKIEDGDLQCPCCPGNNLHQISVTAFFRAEDAERGVAGMISDEGGGVFTKATMEDNPSARRDGLSIAFTCENCHGDPTETDRIPHVLNVVQHKGFTLMYWVE
jgi:hypothetical protein